jgi:hypothetical protein
MRWTVRGSNPREQLGKGVTRHLTRPMKRLSAKAASRFRFRGNH